MYSSTMTVFKESPLVLKVKGQKLGSTLQTLGTRRRNIKR